MGGWLEAIILGIVQGLTEFLPISSSAHIRIVSTLFGTGTDPGAAFTAILQLGTETAVLIYFLPDIVHIVTSWVKALFGRIPRNDPNAKLGWFIIIGSIPIVVLGLLFQKDNPLVSCVNAAVDDLKRDGTLASLEKKWLSQTTGVPELK